jgi:hypothetical protein
MTTEQTVELDQPTTTRGRKAAAATSDVAQYNPNEKINVIIQRPPGAMDSHIFVGFNDTEGQYKYDEVVSLPRAAVDYLRQQKVVVFRPDEKGKPVPTYANAYSIIDA